MTNQSAPDADVRRPTKAAAASSPTALSNLIASLLVLAGFFLPHSADCDDRVQRPITIAQMVVTESDEARDYLALTIFWPYAFAGLTAATIVLLVHLRPRWIEHGLLALPIICSASLSVAWMLFLFSRTDNSRLAMMIAATTVPSGAFVAARMIWLYRSGQVAAAAAWGQGWCCVLAAFSLRWFWFPPVARLLWGGILAVGSTLLMMIASWIWITRARYDLYDRSVKPLPFQISLRQIIVGITITAIALMYWNFLATH